MGYADDIVILADFSVDVRKKLNILYKYTTANKLTVNASKRKIVFFHKDKAPTLKEPFKCGGEIIGLTNKFSYLGITF